MHVNKWVHPADARLTDYSAMPNAPVAKFDTEIGSVLDFVVNEKSRNHLIVVKCVDTLNVLLRIFAEMNLDARAISAETPSLEVTQALDDLWLSHVKVLISTQFLIGSGIHFRGSHVAISSTSVLSPVRAYCLAYMNRSFEAPRHILFRAPAPAAPAVPEEVTSDEHSVSGPSAAMEKAVGLYPECRRRPERFANFLDPNWVIVEGQPALDRIEKLTALGLKVQIGNQVWPESADLNLKG